MTNTKREVSKFIALQCNKITKLSQLEKQMTNTVQLR
jgi:hypothetical protein